MKVPLSWLREFVDFELDSDDLATKLTSSGLKVEKVTRPGAELAGVVVAEVLGINPHPDADKLVLVDVRSDAGERQVVCGAKNFAVGDRVPLALPGSRLPEYPRFEAKKIRGVLSDGMLCSARDMGLDDDHSGIYLLDPSAPLGADVKEVLGLGDIVFELEVTPNRPDAMCIVGVAREVAAVLGTDIRLPRIDLNSGGPDVASLTSVQVQDTQGCPRYLARVISGVKVSSSPPEIQRRLTFAGVRPISNVVDATNYALLVTGHPLHAFDLDRLQGRRIVVRRASPGEKIVTLDERERELSPEDLVIADASAPVAIAGVMGGRDTEVSDSTVNVLLESAYFAPRDIFRTSQRHGLRSEASARFERGADPEAVTFAADLACALIVSWAGGQQAPGEIDVYPTPVAPRTIRLRPARARALLGTETTDDAMVDALGRLGLSPHRDGSDIVVMAPTRRVDLSEEEDLIEEVARIVGYDVVPSTLPPGASRHGRIGNEEQFVRRLRAIFAGTGLLEARTNSLVGPDLVSKVATTDPSSDPIPLANALTAEQSLLRPSLIPGLVDAAIRNLARRRTEVRLFEIGVCFTRSSGPLPAEPLLAGMVLAGGEPTRWYSKERRFDFFDAKGALEAVFSSLRVDAEFLPAHLPGLHPTRSAQVSAGGLILGTVGELSRDVLDRMDVDVPVVVAELQVRALMEATGPVGGYRDAYRFPAVLLDLAVVVDGSVTAADVLRVTRAAGGDLLEQVSLFDVYRGDQLPAGRKSIALSLSFRSPDRTLTEQEALAARDEIAAALAAELGGSIRA